MFLIFFLIRIFFAQLMIEKTVEGSAAIVSNSSPELLELSEKIRNFSKRTTQTMDEVARPNPDHFSALLHGDCWSNNFMFFYDDDNINDDQNNDKNNANKGKLKSMKILDFQLMRYGCVCLDLVSIFF